MVAVEATTIDCASIILPMTPPDELAALINTEDSPNCSDVIFCRLPNNTLEAVSEPVSATPNHGRAVGGIEPFLLFSAPNDRADNQLHLTGNSFDPRSGLDGGGTANLSEAADLARLPGSG